jgi:hypothetical protein
MARGASVVAALVSLYYWYGNHIAFCLVGLTEESDMGQCLQNTMGVVAQHTSSC